jgi:phosphoribosylanthranilate isomerase
MSSLFRIKICGVTRPADALAVDQAGGDAVGLNFCRHSPRFIDDATAVTIATACPPSLQKVGVFVNEPLEQIRRRVQLLGLDWVQLHGDESPELIAQLAGQPVIRAFRCRGPLQPLWDYLEQCRSLGHMPQAVLLDTWRADQYGGSGETLDWSTLRSQLGPLSGIPWILAGGLRAENVGRAIQLLGPTAVDTASGVETSPGCKDATAIGRFIQAARSAFKARVSQSGNASDAGCGTRSSAYD